MRQQWPRIELIARCINAYPTLPPSPFKRLRRPRQCHQRWDSWGALAVDYFAKQVFDNVLHLAGDNAAEPRKDILKLRDWIVDRVATGVVVVGERLDGRLRSGGQRADHVFGYSRETSKGFDNDTGILVWNGGAVAVADEGESIGLVWW